MANKKWTKEKCHQEALKYNTRKDFKFKSAYVYKISGKNKILNDICSHMIEINKPKNYWTKEKCQKEALKYEHKQDFHKKSSSAYIISYNKKWLNDICSHMKILGNRKMRCIYSVIFEYKYIKYVYVGLTFNFYKRKQEHLIDKRSTVFKFMKKTKIIPVFKQLIDYISINDAINKEKYFVNYFKNNEFVILNKAKTGGIGGD